MFTDAEIAIEFAASQTPRGVKPSDAVHVFGLPSEQGVSKRVYSHQFVGAQEAGCVMSYPDDTSGDTAWFVATKRRADAQIARWDRWRAGKGASE